MPHWVGQAAQESALLRALWSERTPHAWLLTGPRGLGKAAFARRAATYIVSTDPSRPPRDLADESLDSVPDGQALRLIEAGSHPDFIWLEREIAKSKRGASDGEKPDEADLARNITIDQVRDMIARLRTRPAIAHRRAIVIDSIDDLERGAANALLKTLEEPPADCVIFLISHAPGRLLPTIRSRCRLLRFMPLDSAAMTGFITGLMPDASPDAVSAVVRVARGSPGRAQAFARLGLAEVAQHVERILVHGDADLGERSALVKALSGAANKPKLEAALALTASLVADHAREATRPDVAGLAASLPRLLDVHDRINDIARYAISSSEDAATVAFAMGSALAQAR